MRAALYCFGLCMICLLSESGAGTAVGCTRGHYLSNGDCLPCPDGCKTCTSVTSCDECIKNKYGPTCQETCKHNCTIHNCHKIHGHCSEECPDGKHPNLGNKTREECPPSCDICCSPTQCIICKNGYVGPYDGRCAITCQEAYKHRRIDESIFPESNCDQISPNENMSKCSVVRLCINPVKCPENINCSADSNDLTSKDSDICVISETHFRSKECQRINDTFCPCQTNYSSWISQQQQLPICRRDSDELFASPKTECFTVSEDQTTVISTTQPPSNTTALIAVVIVLSLLIVAMVSYIALMKRNLITYCIRCVFSPRSPENRHADSEVEEGMPMTQSTNDEITSPSTNGTN